MFMAAVNWIILLVIRCRELITGMINCKQSVTNTTFMNHSQ